VSEIIIVFRHSAIAEYRVAGLPAAARAVRAAIEQADHPVTRCLVFAGVDWMPSTECQVECARLAAGIPVAFTGALPVSTDMQTIDGEALIVTSVGLSASVRHTGPWGQRAIGQTGNDLSERLAMLRRAGRTIIGATGKPGDGIVSRYVNRPISQSISRFVLTIPGVRPLHATIGTAALGTAMALCLVFGGAIGLVLGAILFQAASILDGVDGEIARATFRTSACGAMLDSIIDAATNLSFIAGLAVNLGMAGDRTAASAGATGLLLLALGLLLIGRRAKALGQPVNFDVIKVHFRKRKSAVMEWLIWLTMRDFFAAAGALLILLGDARQALFAFASVAAIWLMVVVNVLARTRRAATILPSNRTVIGR